MKRLASFLPVLGAVLVPVSAMAHPGHILPGESPFVAGLIHPLTGADHIAAMLMVGLGTRLFVRKDGWFVPLAFIAGLVMGFATCGLVTAAMAEAGILVSLVGLGLAVALRITSPMPVALGAVALFGYAHGAAHGLEMPSGVMPLVFAAGFVAASAALHFGGYALARLLPMPALRLIGLGGAGLGLALAAAG